VVLLAAMLVIGIGLAFYWYEYRPSQIRSTCESKSMEQAKASFKTMGKGPPEDLFVPILKGAYYMSCLREHGLER
jgi:hypothetical protein